MTEFNELNKWFKVNPFQLPMINKTLQKFGKFKSIVAVDLLLEFYTIPLDEENQKICSTILLWWKYSYLRMPMGVACALSMFQSILIETLRGLDVLVYIDEIVVIQQETESLSDHLVKVE